MSAIGRAPSDDAAVQACELDGGDIVLFEPENGRAFIRATPESIIDLSKVNSR